MHPDVMGFCAQVAASAVDAPSGLEGFGLDLGGRDVNGHARRFWPWLCWHVVDLAFPEWPRSWPVYYDRPDDTQGTEWLCRGDATEWPSPGSPAEGTYDLVLSTELLEHVAGWRRVLESAGRALRRPGGVLVVTCAGPGRPEHGAQGGELAAGEHYANLEPDALGAAVDALGLEWRLVVSPSSLGGNDLHLIAWAR